MSLEAGGQAILEEKCMFFPFLHVGGQRAAKCLIMAHFQCSAKKKIQFPPFPVKFSLLVT